MRSDNEGLLYVALRPHTIHDFGWLRCVVRYRTARFRHICWRPKHEHATVGEIKTPTTGKVHPHLMASPKNHAKRSLTYAMRASLAPSRKSRHKLGSISGGIRKRNAPSAALPRRGMIRRCGALTMTATNVSCGIVRWRRAATRGSTASLLLHTLPSFLLLTKQSL